MGTSIVGIFNNNSPADFTYQDYIEDILGGTESDDLKVIASRGKIEGPLGQVQKIHGTGIMDRGVGTVIYTNDLKAEALVLLPQMFAYLKDRLIRIYDEHPKVVPFVNT